MAKKIAGFLSRLAVTAALLGAVYMAVRHHAYAISGYLFAAAVLLLAFCFFSPGRN